MKETPLKILFLAAWYPNKYDNMFGLFVRRHAIAVSKFAYVNVVSVVSTSNLDKVYTIETKIEENLTEILIYTKKADTLFRPLNMFINAYRYINAHIAAWKILEATDSKPDITHVHILTRAGLIALFFKLRYKVPYIITEHWSRYLAHHNGYNGLVRRKLTQKVVNMSEGVSTVSSALKDGMNAAGLYHKNWQIIPNVVDTKMFKCDISKRSKVFRFSHISCFEQKSKNMFGILEAIKKLKNAGIDFEFYMIGDGSDWKETVDKAKNMQIADIITFTGILHGQELVDTINSCHCSIIFSNYETFSIAIPENLACGVPVIASEVGGIPEVLPAKFGMLIPPGDIDRLTAAMKEMICNMPEYDVDAMAQYVEESYSYSEIGFRFYRMCKEAVSEKEKGDLL